MEFEEVRLLKQSEKTTVLLIREKGDGRFFVRKIMRGRHQVYEMLQGFSHPCLPKVYEVVISDDTTAVIEEYIDGQSLGKTALSEKLACDAVKELCSVLQFLHESGVIHRDIKPSNIILANDGHIRLIDFDSARMMKDEAEQDTRLLGTRGYAPPEQYGFAQTDARADIYSLGVTFGQLLGKKAKKLRYKRIIKKCTDWNPNKRYQSAKQALRALNLPYGYYWYLAAALAAACMIGAAVYNDHLQPPKAKQASSHQPQTQDQTEAASELLQPRTTDEDGFNPSSTEKLTAPTEEPTEGSTEEPTAAEGESRIVLTDLIQAPFNTISAAPVHLIGGEWRIDDPTSPSDATLYKDNKAIAKVILFEDGGRSDIRSRKIKIWAAPAIASEYIQLSEYLELDMSKDEVLAALDDARPYPPMVLVGPPSQGYAEGEYERIALVFEDYSIIYFFMYDMTMIEVEALIY
jgi:serine/threonine protein kinase